MGYLTTQGKHTQGRKTRGALPYTQNMHYTGTTTNTLLLLRQLYVSSIWDRQHVCAHTETNPPKTVVILQELPKKRPGASPGTCRVVPAKVVAVKLRQEQSRAALLPAFLPVFFFLSKNGLQRTPFIIVISPS